jgi:glycosyltransferase involved in cell wall biosynthesis
MRAFNPIDHPICFTHPLWIAPSSWIEHVPFAMFIVDFLRPRLVVELGTAFGISYCAFCQAVYELGLDTRCYAIDTWEGDPQTGFYGPTVLEELRRHHDPLYGSFSQLVKSTFDDALAQFKDETIDLLHIDGQHSYESVSGDYKKWLPKMSDRGVILFHDINVRERGYEVWRLWEEVKAKYPSFEFHHEHGLGVLGVGKDLPDGMRNLLSCDESEAVRIRQFFYQLGLRLRISHEREEQIKVLKGRVNECEEQIRVLKDQANEVRKLRNERLTLMQTIECLEAALFRINTQAGQLHSTIAAQQQVISEKERELKAIHSSLGWKLLSGYIKLKNGLLPLGSRRRKFYTRLSRAAMGMLSARRASGDGAKLPAIATKPPIDERPTIFVLQPFLSLGGAEILTAEIMKRLSARFRFVVITTEPLSVELGTTKDRYQAITPFIYDFSEMVDRSRYTSLFIQLVRAFNPKTLFVANGVSWFYDSINELAQALPDLWVVNQVYDHRVGWIERYDQRLCDCVDFHIAPNRLILKAYREQFGIDEKHSRLIPHGIDLTEFDPALFSAEDVKDLKVKFGLPEDRLIVTFMGRLAPQKRPVDFIALAKRLEHDDRFYFFMVGDGPSRRSVEQFIELYRLGNIKRISFHCPSREVLAVSDIFCLMSEFEGMPLVVLESLAMNVPVLSTKVGCVAEILSNGNGRIIEVVGDIDSFAVALESMASKEELDSIRLGARQVIERNFNIDEIALEYGKVLLPSDD